MIDKLFTTFIHDFTKQYKKEIFSNISKCKSLLLDHAKGEYKNEIRLLLQALDMGCYATIMASNDLNITRMALIKQLQEEYFISENIASLLVDLLLFELRKYKEKQTEKAKPVIVNSNQPNLSEQNQSVKNDRKEIIDTNLIREMGSIISTKELANKKFNEKVKSIYEPTFIEYQKVMNDNNLKCRHGIWFTTNTLYLDFLFVKNFNTCYNANYSIKKGNGVNVETRWYFVSHDYNAEKEFVNETHPSIIDNLTKERVLDDLKLFTEKVLKIIKKRHN